MGRFANTVHIWAPFDDIKIDFEHALFTDNPVVFEYINQQNLFEFPGKRFVTRQEYIFNQLHTNRTRATREFFSLEVFDDRLLKRLVNKALMREKRRVFCS